MKISHQLIVCLSLVGSEHQELPVATLADTAQLLVPAPPASHWHAASEQSDGAVVAHALPHAPSVRISPRVQGVVRQPPNGHDRRKQGVQRESHPPPAQGGFRGSTVDTWSSCEVFGSCVYRNKLGVLFSSWVMTTYFMGVYYKKNKIKCFLFRAKSHTHTHVH